MSSPSSRDVFSPLTEQELGALEPDPSMDSTLYKHFVSTKEDVDFTVLDVLDSLTPQQHVQVKRHNCNNDSATQVLSNVDPDARARIVAIGAIASTEPLNISFVQMSQIFMQYGVEEDFWEVIRCFGSSPHPAEGGCTHAFARTYQDGSQSCCYDLQYMDDNERGGFNRWSQRHTGVYHRRVTRPNKKQFDFVIVLHPSIDTKFESMLDRLDRTGPWERSLAKRIHGDPGTVHEVLLETYLKTWRWYLREKGDGFQKRNDYLLAMDQDITKAESELLGFQTVQGFRATRDHILTAAAFCKGNQAVIDLLMGIHTQEGSTFRTNGAALKERVRGYINGLDALQSRIDNSIALLEYSLQLKHQELATSMNRHMEELTHSTVDDSATVRNITKLGLFYLPPTFICGLFGMNFFDYDNDTNYLVIAPNFWIFVVVSVLLTGATWVIYYVSERHMEKTQLRPDERAAQPSMGRRVMRSKGKSDTFNSKTTASTGRSTVLPKYNS